jgi:hypothetical protein
VFDWKEVRSEERAACMRLVKCDGRLCAKDECFSQNFENEVLELERLQPWQPI